MKNPISRGFPVNGEALRKLRLQAGMTQAELAERAGYSKRQIERLEAGERSTTSTLTNLAQAVGATVDELVDPGDEHLAPAIARVRSWVDLRREERRNRERVRRATLATVVAPEAAGVALVFHSKERQFEYAVRANATVAELASAIAKEHFANRRGLVILTDTEGVSYPDALTAMELQQQGITSLHLYLRTFGIPLAMPPWRLITTTAQTVWRLRHGWGLFQRIVGFVLLVLHGLPVFRRFMSPTWIMAQMNELADGFSEAAVNLKLAGRLADAMEKSPLANDWSFQDTIAWVRYRQGRFNTALAILSSNLTGEALDFPPLLCHLYFMCQRVGATDATHAIRERFSEMLPEEDRPHDLAVESFPRHSTDAGMYELQVRRVLTNNDLLMPARTWNTL